MTYINYYLYSNLSLDAVDHFGKLFLFNIPF